MKNGKRLEKNEDEQITGSIIPKRLSMEKLLMAAIAFVFGFLGFMLQKIIDKLYFERLANFNKLRGDISRVVSQILCDNLKEYMIDKKITKSKKIEFANNLNKCAAEVFAFKSEEGLNWFLKKFLFTPKIDIKYLHADLIVVAWKFEKCDFGIEDNSECIHRINRILDNIKFKMPKVNEFEGD